VIRGAAIKQHLREQLQRLTVRLRHWQICRLVLHDLSSLLSG
jgi:hypothetical protein